jgi:cytochrome oxidase Cu insertion factor (SCO1/SenC/PrrC family)
MYFMDRDGKFLEFFTQLSEAQEVADRITAHLKKA